MSIVALLLPLALVLSGTFVVFFIWNSKNGQFDDLETPPMRAVFEDTNTKKGNSIDEFTT